MAVVGYSRHIWIVAEEILTAGSQRLRNLLTKGTGTGKRFPRVDRGRFDEGRGGRAADRVQAPEVKIAAKHPVTERQDSVSPPSHGDAGIRTARKSCLCRCRF
jgi:hypothetical protein